MQRPVLPSFLSSIFSEEIFYPKFFTTIKTYNKKLFVKDLLAGVIMCVVALPMSIAFGIASGVTPEVGLITAIVGGFLIAFLGGSRVQIGGPAGSFILVVSGVVASYGMSGLVIVTILAGIMLIFMGLLKLGDVIKFMPYPVVVGFTSGMAVVIFSTQIKDFFGLDMGNVPLTFHEKWYSYFMHFESINFYATGIALATVILSFLWTRINRTIPAALIAIILTTVAVQIFNLPVETIGSRFGEIELQMSSPKFPSATYDAIRDLLPIAFTVAMLCAIESLLSAMVTDGVIGGKHRSNTELIAEGFANIGCGLFGGMPAAGAVARSMTNIKNGGRTPVAGMVHAVTLLILLLAFGQYAKMIPMPCLAGILVVVSYNMSEWRSFRGLFRNSRSEVVVLLATFLLTVIFDITLAIEVGLVLALFLFVRRISKTSEVQIFTNTTLTEDGDLHDNSTLPNGVEIFRINGPFFFGVANKFEEAHKLVRKAPKVRIIDMALVPFMDATGLQNMYSFFKKCQNEKVITILARVNTNVMEDLKSHILYKHIGATNIFPDLEEAVTRSTFLIQKMNDKTVEN
ncbi:MAG: SulP family inorganic anion transporter [Bacteroidales bacterium]